jgi:Uma2 family endonuclease
VELSGELRDQRESPEHLHEDRWQPRDKGARASEVIAIVIGLLGNHVHAQNIGKVFTSECGYKIFPDQPRRVIFPDVSYIKRDRLPQNKTPPGHVTIPPDIAVEVISPNDLAEEVEAKRASTLQAGVQLVWLFYPSTQTVHVHRLDGSCTILSGDKELGGEDVLPGFTAKVSAFFEEA